MMTFANVYKNWFDTLMNSANCEFSCRGLPIGKEISPASISIQMPSLGPISVFSCATHRVVPIKFVLAELCYILAGRDDVESIASYNSGMSKYSEDGGNTISGSYGLRLRNQLESMISRLVKDEYTRQACAVIYSKSDAISDITHMPCNVFLQFLYRDNKLNLHVFSRSSDFVTGLSIDAIHWQFLLQLMKNELGTWRYAGTVYYTLNSLHIYQNDMSVVSNWHVDIDSTYEYMLDTFLTLRQAIADCKEYFKAGLSLKELCSLLGFYGKSESTAYLLEDLFKNHRNRLVR